MLARAALIVDDQLDGIHEVIQMHEGLPMRSAAGVEVARELALVYALNLVGQRDRVAEIVIDAGDAQQHCGDITALLPDELLGADL